MRRRFSIVIRVFYAFGPTMSARRSGFNFSTFFRESNVAVMLALVSDVRAMEVLTSRPSRVPASSDASSSSSEIDIADEDALELISTRFLRVAFRA